LLAECTSLSYQFQHFPGLQTLAAKEEEEERKIDRKKKREMQFHPSDLYAFDSNGSIFWEFAILIFRPL
jgi:hypothetical protein